MSSKKETPRQKMISMMYLVLTAMLALNVSKEVLEGYSVVNSSLEVSNDALVAKRSDVYARLNRDYSFNQIEVGPYLAKSNVARKLSSDMIAYITNLRDELIAVTENIPVDSVRNVEIKDLKNKDNYTIPTRFMLAESGIGLPGRAGELKMKLSHYRKAMLELINPQSRKKLTLGLETGDVYSNNTGKYQKWENHYFYEIPLAADIPILNKFITEVINAELSVLNELIHEISADDYRYDQIAARVMPKTNYLFTGDQYEAEVIVAAYDTTRTPDVYLMQGVDSLPLSMKDKATLISGSKGQIFFKIPASRAGLAKYAGFVSVRNNSGAENTYHFKNEYFVASPSLSVSATNMNVLYVGVNNPVSIAVSGEIITPVISCGTLKPDRGTGNWIATVPGNCHDARIDVLVRENGVQKKLGSQTFRVKRLPDPTPFIIGANNGYISRENLIQNARIIASMPSDFEFQLSYKVVSFRMNMQRGFNVYNFDAKGERLTEEMKREIKNTNRGQVVIFEDVVVIGPDGANRTLSPLILSIK